jgi:kynurenine formamidase
VFTRFVDISMPIANDTHVDPPGHGPKIEYLDHKQGTDILVNMYGGVFTADQLPDQEGPAAEVVTLSTHSGTHMDAPWHYGRTMDEGKPAWSIDEVPLEWGFGRGVKLDFRNKPDGHVVSAAEIQEELARIGHTLAPGDIVLVNTRAPEEEHTGDFLDAGCGIGREATLWMIEQGVRTMGTDGWSWDAPFVHVGPKIAETGDMSLVWEGHYAGKTRGYAQLEKLYNLAALPANGFYVACFPVKIKGASAGWTRAVAMFQ